MPLNCAAATVAIQTPAISAGPKELISNRCASNQQAIKEAINQSINQ
jgi:hypothetical protein